MALKLKTSEQYEKMAGTPMADLCAEAFVELDRACKKFPLFPDEFTWLTQDGVGKQLSLMRSINDQSSGQNATAQSVIMEEFYEFMEAVVDRDAEKARKELVQVMAMLMRTYVHLDEYCQPV